MSNMNARAREKQAKITIDASLLNLKNQSTLIYTYFYLFLFRY